MKTTKTALSALLASLALCAGAQAQSCGSGGGATVCLSASGTPDNIQLSWTVSGNVTGLQVYRDTDADPKGRHRIAFAGSTATSYTDGSAAIGTPYWYWIKFVTPTGSYNSGAASATRPSSCQPSTVWPWIGINSTWTPTASASVAAGTRLVLGPQPGGSWSWSGCGTSGSAREQTLTASASCTATAVYTNACGAQTTQLFSIDVPQLAANDGRYIVVDQFGYLPTLKKVAVLRDPVVGYDSAEAYTPGATLQVINTATGAVAYSGAPTSWNNGATDDSSGDRAWLFDFSALTAPGSYRIVDVERNLRSYPFEIGANVYRPVLVQALRTFFYQRAGHAKLAQYAGSGWADGASHLGPLQDANARRYDALDDASTERDLRGGWYDAGDLNKYTNPGAAYVTELLHAYLENPSIWSDDFNIPESGNGVPDILDEAKWGMDWLMRMQNADGSVLSLVGLASASPPSAATGQSRYGNASTSATLSAAMAFAHGAKVYGAVPGFSAYAADLAARARNAWAWAAANPSVVFYNNDEAHGTAGLGAGQMETDDNGRLSMRLVTAVYMFALTGEVALRDYVDAHYTEAPMFKSWWLSPFSSGVTRPLLYYTALANATPAVAADIRGRYASLWESAGWEHITGRTDPYGAFITDYTWSSNAVKSLAGGMFADLGLYDFGGHGAQESADAGAEYLHYLHGVNPLSKVYLSNMGAFGAENSIDQFFHTWFADGSPRWDSVKESTYGPAPGFLVGGPQPGWDWDSRCPGISPQCGTTRPTPPYGQPKQKSYKDFNSSWPLGSWSLSENSNGYQTAYIRLLARYVK